MKIAYRQVDVRAEGGAIVIRLEMENRSRENWTAENFVLGWQLFDPESNRFIRDGEWTKLAETVKPGGVARIEMRIEFPPEAGGYHIYVSPLSPSLGWAYARGEKFLLIVAEVEAGGVAVRRSEIATTRTLRLRNLRRILPDLFAQPIASNWRNRRLIRSMVKRDILARYRGSFGGALWTLLNPLLLMSTYFFVFGVVLRTRFGNDASGGGYVLYFLAGMLPWLAVSEAVGRAPYSIPEHRNFVKKLVFPLEAINVVQVFSGVVTEVVALAIFFCGVLAMRGGLPQSVLWLPALIVPQILFTLGLCWFLAALGAFVRDLGQIIGFTLTLWFFLTPICYPESSLPKAALGVLTKNPMFFLVKGYREVFLSGRAPEWHGLALFWLFAAAIFLAGHAWFYKLRRSFADVI